MPMHAHIRWSCGRSTIPGDHTTLRIVRSSARYSAVSAPRSWSSAEATTDGAAVTRVSVSRIALRGSLSPRACRQSSMNVSTSNIGKHSLMADVTVERRGEVDLVTINRPEVRNALRFQSYRELEAAVRETTARCLVITGADPAFCSGDDVREVMGGGEANPVPVAVAPQLTPAAGALLTTDVPV